MALDPSKVQFLFNRINNADLTSFVSSCAHMFEHLQANVKDNPIYDLYESNCEGWYNWIDNLQSYTQFVLPKSLKETQSLSNMH